VTGWLAENLPTLGIERLEHPAWLALGAALALAAAALALRARPAAVAWSALAAARAAGARRIDPVRGAGIALRTAALVALAAVVAGPVAVHRPRPEPGLGLDLVLVVDASGSMRALDARVAGAWRTRLDLAREVVARFAAQRAAEGDRVGLVVFGESAFTQCPLTSDGGLLAAGLSRVEAGVAGEATALGDSLALAVKRVGGAEGAVAPLAGRVVVLLTDGRANAGAVSVEVAAALAAAAGVRVHTVGIGSSGEQVPMEERAGSARRGLRFERHDVDVGTLEAIAAATGGRFFHARRSSDLDAVYAAIDRVERVERPLPSRWRRSERPEPLLAAAGALLLGEIALVRVARRRIP
jgi:Ca-activated chloride channel family protein